MAERDELNPREKKFIDAANSMGKRGTAGPSGEPQWTDSSGEQLSHAKVVQTPDDMDNAIRNRDASGDHGMAKAVQSAEGRPQHIARALSTMIMSYPSAVNARAKENRSHVWHMYGAAGAGKTFNSQVMIAGLNNMSLFAQQAIGMGADSKTAKQDLAVGAKALFGETMKQGGIDIDNFDFNKYGSDFYDSIKEYGESGVAPKVDKIGKFDQSYGDIKGLLSVQQAALTASGGSTADVQKVAPQTPAIGIDDLYSTAPQNDKGTYTSFVDRLGDGSTPLALALFTHNLDNEHSEGFDDSHRTAGTKDRAGLALKVGSRGEAFDKATARNNHSLMNDVIDARMMDTLHKGSQLDDSGKALHGKQAQMKDSMINNSQDPEGANRFMRGTVDPLMSKIKGHLGDNYGKVMDMMTGEGAGGVSNTLNSRVHPQDGYASNATQMSLGLQAFGGMDQKEADALGGEFSSASRTAREKLGSDFATGKQANATTTGRQSAVDSFASMADDVHSGNANSTEVYTPGTDENSQRSDPTRARGTDIAKLKKSVEGMKVNAETAKSRITSNADQANATSYNKHGFVEGRNSAHACEMMNSSEVSPNDISVDTDDPGTKQVISSQKLRDSRPMKQLGDVMDSVKRYMKNPNDAKEFGRDAIVNLFGYDPISKVLMTQHDLFPAGRRSRTAPGLPTISSDPNNAIGDMHNPTTGDFDKAGKMINEIVSQSGNAITASTLETSIGGMFDGLMTPQGINGDIDAGLTNMSKLLHLAKNNPNDIRSRLDPTSMKEKQTLGSLTQLADQDFKKKVLSDADKKNIDDGACASGGGGNQARADNAVSQHMENTTKFGGGLNNNRIMRGLGLS